MELLKTQAPNSKTQVPRLEFEFLDLKFGILEMPLLIVYGISENLNLNN